MDICPFTKKPCAINKITHITEISDSGEVSEIHLCHVCTIAYLSIEEMKHKKEEYLDKLKNQISKILDPIVKQFEETKYTIQSVSTVPCPKCKYTIIDIIKHGKMGCDNCINHFKDEILLILKKVQAGTQHIGKVPKTHVTKKSLELKLQQAIVAENYEEAARIKAKLSEIQ